MARGALRGIAAGSLALIALETVLDGKAPQRVSGLWGLLDTVAQRVLDPSVPAIPDRSQGVAASMTNDLLPTTSNPSRIPVPGHNIPT